MSKKDKENESTPEPKKKRGMMLVLIPLVLVAAAGGGWVAFTQYARLSAAAAVFAESEQPEDAPIEYGEFLEIQGIIINPAESNGQRYLMVNIGLESDKAKVLEEIESKEIVVRDKMVKMLGEHTVEILADISQRQTIKDELREAINKVLEKGEVQRLYFTQYVLQ